MDMDKIKVAEVLKTISKNATQCILSNLQKCEKYSFNNEDFKGFKVINVEFADGYYDNQFVEFEIEETPEWLYGIWWNGANEYNQLLGCFFAQYKENIDKFKPTHSNIKVLGMTAYTVRDRNTPYERDMANPETDELFCKLLFIKVLC